MAMVKNLLAVAVLVGLASATSRLELFRKTLSERSQANEAIDEKCPEPAGTNLMDPSHLRCRLTEVMEIVLGSIPHLKDSIEAAKEVNVNPTRENFKLAADAFEEFVDKTMGDYDKKEQKYTPGLFDKLLDRIFRLIIRMYIGTTGFECEKPACAEMEDFDYKVDAAGNPLNLTEEVEVKEYMSEMGEKVAAGVQCLATRMEGVKVLEDYVKAEKKITDTGAFYLATAMLKELYVFRRDSQHFAKAVGKAYERIKPHLASQEQATEERALKSLLKRLLEESEKP